MRLLLAAILFFTLVLLGLITLRGELILLSLPLAVYIGAAIIFIPAAIKLNITREIDPSRVIHGEHVNVKVRLHNGGDNLREAIIEDKIPALVKVMDGNYSLITDLSPNEILELDYKIEAKRGIHFIPGIKVISGDPFGLFQLNVTYPNEGEVKVLPRSPRIKNIPVRPDITKGNSGIFPSRKGGRGIEFYNVREYQPGDSLNIINWLVSARGYDRLFSNEFQMEKTADFWLILDARQRSDFKFNGESLFEIMVEITAAIAQSLLHTGNRVGLLIYGGFLDWTYLGHGKKQREKILMALTKAKSGESRIFEKLENLPTRIFPPRSQIIFISPIHSEDYQFLSSIKARSYQVLCISPDPITFELGVTQSVDRDNPGARLAMVERRFLLSRLRYSGIQVMNIDACLPVKISLGHIPAVIFHREKIIRSIL